MESDFRIQSEEDLGAVIKTAISLLPKDEFLQLVTDENQYIIRREKIEGLQEVAADLEKFSVICMMMRPGVMLFQSILENKYFPVGTPENDKEFEWRILEWMDLKWTIVTIPFAKKDFAYRAAEEAKMKIADGIPRMAVDGEWHSFPMDSPNVFSIENQSGSKIYEGPGGVQDANVEENLQVQRVRKEHGPPYFNEESQT